METNNGLVKLQMILLALVFVLIIGVVMYSILSGVENMGRCVAENAAASLGELPSRECTYISAFFGF